MARPTDGYSVREVNGTTHRETLLDLQRRIFPSDTIVDPARGYWWLVRFEGEAVGFASIRDIKGDAAAGYMTMAGVLSAHKGKGLQRRLIAARLRKARACGWSRVITTTYDNPKSINNLIRAGFRAYQPAFPWMATGTCYWLRSIEIPVVN